MSVKFNPIGPPFDFTGKGQAPSVRADNFSYTTVILGKTVTVPVNQQMLFKGVMIVRGLLINRGQIMPVEDNHQQMGHWNPIPSGQFVLIPENRTMFFKFIFKNYGTLRNQGTLEAT